MRLGYYGDDGRLIDAGRLAMTDKVQAELSRRLAPWHGRIRAGRKFGHSFLLWEERVKMMQSRGSSSLQ